MRHSSDRGEREQELRGRLARDPSDPQALRELAELLAGDRRRKHEAVTLWERYAEAVEPEHRGAALLELARSQVAARRADAAIATLQRATAIAPDSAEAHDLLGELLRHAGRLEEAAAALSRAAELEPSATRPRAALVICYDALGRADEAEAVLAELDRIAGDDPAVTALLRELVRRRA